MLEGTSGHHLVQPPAKKGSLVQVTKEGVQADFEHLQRKRLHGLSEQAMPVLCKPQRIFSSYSYGTSCIPVCAHYLLFSHWTPLKRV